jgi:hypothetical protein
VAFVETEKDTRDGKKLLTALWERLKGNWETHRICDVWKIILFVFP